MWVRVKVPVRIYRVRVWFTWHLVTPAHLQISKLNTLSFMQFGSLRFEGRHLLGAKFLHRPVKQRKRNVFVTYHKGKTLFNWVSMYLAWEYQLRTLVLHLLLDTGSPSNLVIWTARRSPRRLRDEGSAFISQLFKYSEYWSGPGKRSRSAIMHSTNWANPSAMTVRH